MVGVLCLALALFLLVEVDVDGQGEIRGFIKLLHDLLQHMFVKLGILFVHMLEEIEEGAVIVFRVTFPQFLDVFFFDGVDELILQDFLGCLDNF